MKRLIAASLWFLVGWYVGAAATWALDLGVALGPILAVVGASVVLADPGSVIWSKDRQPHARGA